MRTRSVRVIAAAAFTAALAAPALAASPDPQSMAICPNGMVENVGSYGCVPYNPGVGAPSQEVLSRCHGNYWICIWPYPVP